MAKGAVLVLEDNFLIAIEIEDALLERGFTVRGPAFDLEEAEDLQHCKLCGAILDFNLPHGRTSAPLVHALFEVGVPVVVYTGNPDVPDVLALASEASIVGKERSAEAAVDRLRDILTA